MPEEQEEGTGVGDIVVDVLYRVWDNITTTSDEDDTIAEDTV